MLLFQLVQFWTYILVDWIIVHCVLKSLTCFQLYFNYNLLLLGTETTNK